MCYEDHTTLTWIFESDKCVMKSNYSVLLQDLLGSIGFFCFTLICLFFRKFRPEQLNFLFFEPTKLRYLKIEKNSIRKLKIKKVLAFSHLNFFCTCAYFKKGDKICAFNFNQKPTQARQQQLWLHVRDEEIINGSILLAE